MTITQPRTTATHATPVWSKSKARQLTDKERTEGIEILNTLETVIRAKRLNDHIPLAASNVVRNEQLNVSFGSYVRKFAGYEAPDQKTMVEELLVFCYDTPELVSDRH